MDPLQARLADRRHGLPRASGDGPLQRPRWTRQRWAAPRERGWTRAGALRAEGGQGCPARAGMDPDQSVGPALSARLPRASGDGPQSRLRARRVLRAAPRERGWTPFMVRKEDPRRGCPARAGMDPFVAEAAKIWTRLPRASGDGPFSSMSPSSFRWAAPRERGWTRCAPAWPKRASGCPARAGMDPLRRAAHRFAGRLPRASGDGPQPGAITMPASQAAPRERGWTRAFS